MAEQMTFKEWMKAVDIEVSKEIGLSVHDLPDCPFRDWYDDDVSPKDAAADVIANSLD